MDYPDFRCGENQWDELFHLYERAEKAEISINRKMLAELAVNDAEGFAALVEQSKTALNK